MSDKGHVYQIKLSTDNYAFGNKEGAPLLEINKRAIKGEGEKVIQVYGGMVKKTQLDQLEVRADHREISVKVWTRDEAKVTEYAQAVRTKASEELLKLKGLINKLGEKLDKAPKVIRKDVNKNGVRNDIPKDFEVTPDML